MKGSRVMAYSRVHQLVRILYSFGHSNDLTPAICRELTELLQVMQRYAVCECILAITLYQTTNSTHLLTNSPILTDGLFTAEKVKKCCELTSVVSVVGLVGVCKLCLATITSSA